MAASLHMHAAQVPAPVGSMRCCAWKMHSLIGVRQFELQMLMSTGKWSHCSPVSTTLLPHTGLQLLSFVALQVDGQQLSPFVQVVMFCVTHSRWQFVPVSTRGAHAVPPVQLVGQLPSHFSPVSTTLLPHTGVQLLSFVALQVDGQQLSPLVQVVMLP